MDRLYEIFEFNMMDALEFLLRGIIIYVLTIVLTRIAGLRTFSKMSSFEFAASVAIGSLLATTIITPDQSIPQSALAMVVLYLMQVGVARLRHRFEPIEHLVDNSPLLLMKDGQMLRDNMAKIQVTEDDLMAKLRENNVLRLADVRAVVMETTGKFSVLHSRDESKEVEDQILSAVAT